MTDTIACDISYYQPVVDDTYPHKWLIFRACDGTFRDPHFAANYKWCRKAVKTGRLTGFTVYAVYRPGVDIVSTVQSMVGKPGRHLTVMVDVESWNGEITGDHSVEITDVVKRFADWLGSRDRVLAYGNRYDLAALYPTRPDWLRLVVASYGSEEPDVPHMVAWQYSQGLSTDPLPPGLPRSSRPFGDCDHNIFPGLAPSRVADTLGVGLHKKEPSVSIISTLQVLRGAVVGGKYATARLRKKYPKMVNNVGLVERVAHLEAQVRALAERETKK